jgi:hypothetical protein
MNTTLTSLTVPSEAPLPPWVKLGLRRSAAVPISYKYVYSTPGKTSTNEMKCLSIPRIKTWKQVVSMSYNASFSIFPGYVNMEIACVTI